MRRFLCLYVATLFGGATACTVAPPLGADYDPDMFQLDAARGIRIDVGSREPVIECGFTRFGGPRRVLLYEMKRPDAFWRYFAPARWLLLGQCYSPRGPARMKLVLDNQASEPHPGGQIWLLTAWDSVSHGRWGQMERYAVSSGNATRNYLFGRPEVEANPPDLVTVSMPEILRALR